MVDSEGQLPSGISDNLFYQFPIRGSTNKTHGELKWTNLIFSYTLPCKSWTILTPYWNKTGQEHNHTNRIRIQSYFLFTRTCFHVQDIRFIYRSSTTRKGLAQLALWLSRYAWYVNKISLTFEWAVRCILWIQGLTDIVCSIAAFRPPFHSVRGVHSDVSVFCFISTLAARDQRQATSGCHTQWRHILLSPGVPSKKTEKHSHYWAGVTT